MAPGSPAGTHGTVVLDEVVGPAGALVEAAADADEVVGRAVVAGPAGWHAVVVVLEAGRLVDDFVDPVDAEDDDEDAVVDDEPALVGAPVVGDPATVVEAGDAVLDVDETPAAVVGAAGLDVLVAVEVVVASSWPRAGRASPPTTAAATRVASSGRRAITRCSSGVG